MKILKNIRELYLTSEISKRITRTYAICFMSMILLMNFVLWFGISYALYHPAEATIKRSMENIRDLLSKLEDDTEYFNPNSIREPLVTGVVLRVVDGDGNVFIDTEPRYLSNELFEENIMEDPPFFSDRKMEVAKFGNALVYRAKMDYVHDGENVAIYFLRTITSMNHIFDQITMFLLFLDVFGLLLAIGAGNFVSRSVLKPIKTMTHLAKGIAFGKMDGRIPIPPANDELTELAKTLNAMLDRLQGGISRQQKFVSDTSHELRTPAAVIAGYIDILEKYGGEDKKLLEESVEAIRSEAQNMKNLLENLLFLARTDQDRQKVFKEKFELSEMTSDVIKKMQKIISTHEVQILKNDKAEIFADKTMILQMLRIFLDNAIKYTPRGGKIFLNSEVIGDNVKLSISDTGIGIAEENLEKIFERCVRIDSENLVREVRGSGLGLSIAKWIADNHGIKIEVDSELNKGTKFILTIPIAK